VTAVTIRPARPSDLPAVLALLEAAGLPRAGVPPTLTGFVVGTQGEEIVGVAGMEDYGDCGLLRSVAVHPSLRRAGLGRMLVERVLADAGGRGVRDVYLLTTTAERWFPRLGFDRVERSELPAALAASEEFKGACPASAVAMHLRLREPAESFRVLFLCTGNSARSQIAEALLRARGGDRFTTASAGTHPTAAVHPLALEALRESGIDWRGHAPTHVGAVGGQGWDLVVTVCDGARDACPVIPGAAHTHWPLPDPAAITGSEAERLGAFRDTVRALEQRVAQLVRLAERGLDRRSLAPAAGGLEDALTSP
jgi:N-acetylglutamate synthase-like GNAT family acetyltransferase/protein-tyrosine-phosphatase